MMEADRPLQRTNASFVAWVMLLLISMAAACQPKYDPPSLINKLRILGMRAEPPQVRLGGTTNLSALIAGHDTSQPLCYSWAFCPLAIPLEGRFQCIDDQLLVPLGSSATAQLTSQQVQQAIDPEKLQAVLSENGFELPTQLDTGGQPDIQQLAKQLASFEFYVMFKVATADEHGGTCPTDPGAQVSVSCGDRKRCLQGYKRISLAMLPAYFHDNPRLTGLELGDVPWPEAVTPAAVPYEEKPDLWDQVVESGIDEELFDGYGPTALKLKPTWDEKSLETIAESEDDNGEPAKEELLMSWFSEFGEFQKNRTWDAYPDNLLLLPKLDSGETKREMSIWVVARDGRNGTTWLHRRITVDPSADPAVNPLCAMEPARAGCDASTNEP